MKLLEVYCFEPEKQEFYVSILYIGEMCSITFINI